MQTNAKLDAMEMDMDTDTEHGPYSPTSGAATSPRTDRTDGDFPEPSSAAASAASPSTAAASASTPGAGSARGQEGPGSAKSRRRGLGIVTPNACNECRKKRAKCDGKQPCTRCKTLKVNQCVYEVRVRRSKDHLREEIELLNRQKQHRDHLLAVLARTDRADLREDVLSRLAGGQSADAISEWLASAPPPSANSRRPGNTAAGAWSGSGSSYPHTGGTSSRSGPASHSAPVTGSLSSSNSHNQRSATHSAAGSSTDPWGNHGFSYSPETQGRMPPGGKSGSSARATDGWAKNSEAHQVQTLPLLDHVLAPEMPEMKVPASAWTNVTDDSRLVQHLLALYFCWEYPTFASLSKEHFLRDFQDGRTRYCSSLLVNALLALGCRFSSHPATRASPDDPSTSGDHFFKECLRQLREEHDRLKMTTIQALGIMSIREASCGRDSESWYYAGQSMRLTVEMGLHMTDDGGEEDDETAVRSATFWGAYALDLAWCLATGKLPVCSQTMRLPPKPAIIDDIEASLWIPYTDSGNPIAKSCHQPSNVRSVYKCFCELSELVHRSLYILYAPDQAVTGPKLQKIYSDYINWYGQIPDVLRLGTNFTPSVLFAHMYYHVAILLLFRPFIKLRITGSMTQPKDVCLQAADAIQNLSRSYSKLYTLRRTPSFVPYFVLTSSIMHLTIGADVAPPGRDLPPDPDSHPRMDPHIAHAISRGIADLTEMTPCHNFAVQALNILLYLAKRWNLEIRVKESEDDENQGNGGVMDVLAQYHLVNVPLTHRPGIRPASDKLNFFAPDVTARDIMCAWGLVALQSQPVAASTPPPSGPGVPPAYPPYETPQRNVRRPWMDQEMAPAAAPVPVEPENPVFWAFPLQGRPLIPSGDKLRDAGFEFV